jgi:hypothetical protein
MTWPPVQPALERLIDTLAFDKPGARAAHERPALPLTCPARAAPSSST